MKQSTALVPIGILLTVVALLSLAGCDRQQASATVSSEQAEEAFMVAFGGAYIGSMAAQFNQPLPGVEIDAENQAVVFDAFDVSELETDYTTISGTVRTTADAATVDFTLTGGAVTTISFQINAEQMSNEDGIRATAVVNGAEMEILIDPEGSLR